MFNEPKHAAEENRYRATKMRTTPARMADGTIGLTVFFGRGHIPLTLNEALHLANLIADGVAAAKREQA